LETVLALFKNYNKCIGPRHSNISARIDLQDETLRYYYYGTLVNRDECSEHTVFTMDKYRMIAGGAAISKSVKQYRCSSGMEAG
jgi:hypothetical protein